MHDAVPNDTINALFEAGGAFFQTLSIRRLLKDKRVEGTSLLVPTFITTWGAWNIYYYPSLGQYYSVVAAGLLFAMNAVWLTLAVYFSRKNLCDHI